MARAGVALALCAGLLTTACSSSNRSAEGYCEKLAEFTGPDGAEITFFPGDPDRVGAVTEELRVLLDRAPDEIATTTSTLLEFFESYQRAARDERRDLLIDNEARLARAASDLNDYALENCGLFLQRAIPTPIATSDPGIEVAPE